MQTIKVTKGGYIADVRKVRVRLISGHEVAGIVNIAENNCQRLSELFTKDPNGYIVLCRCDNGHKVMFINKIHIVWAIPLDDT